jgi:hypothetical protein
MTQLADLRRPYDPQLSQMMLSNFEVYFSKHINILPSHSSRTSGSSNMVQDEFLPIEQIFNPSILPARVFMALTVVILLSLFLVQCVKVELLLDWMPMEVTNET